MHLFDHFDSWIVCMTNHNQCFSRFQLHLFFQGQFFFEQHLLFHQMEDLLNKYKVIFIFFYIRGNVGLRIFFRPILKEICSGGIKILKQEEGQKRFPTHLTNICFVPDPLVNNVH